VAEAQSVNRVEISGRALRHNFACCRRRAGAAGIMPLVKADAYGHGMVECARLFAECGAAAFGVAEVVEGVQLREAGIRQAVLVLAGILAEHLELFFEYGLTPVLVDGHLVAPLNRLAVERGRRIGVHLKVDAGMGRQGCLLEDAPAVLSAIDAAPGLRLEGIMAHFPRADESPAASSDQILAGFLELAGRFRAQGREGPVLHIANSGGLFSVQGAILDMVRPGIALYGYAADGSDRLPGTGERLMQAMRFVSRVTQVRQVPAGTGLGYGHTFTTTRPTRLAVIPVGYEDGYPRVLSNRARVLIRGCRVPVLGRISMNLTLADVTGLERVEPGDEVVLLGGQGGERIGADEIAAWMNTIPYEVLCLFGHCNRRVWQDE